MLTAGCAWGDEKRIKLHVMYWIPSVYSGEKKEERRIDSYILKQDDISKFFSIYYIIYPKE